MAKTDSRPFSFRFKVDVGFMLEDLAARWQCSQTAAAERAILEAHESPISTELASFTPNVGGAFVMPSPQTSPASIPGVQVGPKSKCDHCGQMRAPRRVPLCTVCANAGHIGEPRNCGECTGGMGI